MRTYKTIFYEISGICNGKCPYCLSGRFRETGGSFVSTALFDRTLGVIAKNSLLSADGVIGLYNWGEPFLHPQLSELLHTINDYAFSYGFSTNASKIPFIDEFFVKNLKYIRFSMPGFSQASYNRIHGFRFEVILENIKSVVRACRHHGFQGNFSISYHVYQFNLDEIFRCEEFAEKWNITFSPVYAILNNWWHIHAWVDNSLGDDLLKSISEDLFCFEIREKIATAPEDYSCPQYNLLAIDEASNLLLCCQVPPGKEFSCGNMLTDDPTTMLHYRQKNSICEECIRKGLSYYFHTSLKVPGFYMEAIRKRYPNRALEIFAKLTKEVRGRLRRLG